MERNRIFALGIGALVLSACQANSVKTAPVEVVTQLESEVVFSPLVIERDGYCLVGFGVTYPVDVAPHKRQIRVTTHWSGDVVDYPLPIPPLGAPDSYTANDDGTVTFRGMANDSIMECDAEFAARSLAIGPCVEGECLEARFVPDERTASLGIGEAAY